MEGIKLTRPQVSHMLSKNGAKDLMASLDTKKAQAANDAAKMDIAAISGTTSSASSSKQDKVPKHLKL